MPRRFFQRHLPSVERLRRYRSLRLLGEWLHEPALWHLTRRSVAGGCALGLFIAFVPLPLQMLIAALLAVALRVNLPIAVGLVFITNPITLPPVLYASYKLGAWVLRLPGDAFQFHWSAQMFADLLAIWRPVVLGSLLIGLAAGALGYVSIQILWRLHLLERLRRRRADRLARSRQNPKP